MSKPVGISSSYAGYSCTRYVFLKCFIHTWYIFNTRYTVVIIYQVYHMLLYTRKCITYYQEIKICFGPFHVSPYNNNSINQQSRCQPSRRVHSHSLGSRQQYTTCFCFSSHYQVATISPAVDTVYHPVFVFLPVPCDLQAVTRNVGFYIRYTAEIARAFFRARSIKEQGNYYIIGERFESFYPLLPPGISKLRNFSKIQILAFLLYILPSF